MTQNPGKPVSPADLRALDIYDFAKSGRQAAGALRLSQMPRMLAEEADEFPLDDDEVEVIVGSRQFDLVDLIEEELLLSLPLVPKHNVCPEIHESLLPGAADDEPDEGGAQEADEKPNPFAVLEKLKQGGSDDKKH